MTRKLRKCFILAAVASVFVFSAAAAPLGVSTTWSYQVQTMGVGDTFSTFYTASTNEMVVLTAWGAVSDQFNIFVNGSLKLASTVVPDWTDLGMDSALPATDFAGFNQVFASGLYSTATFAVRKGDVISIQLSHLAPDDGSIYLDGTFGAVALHAIPEPVTFGFVGLGLLAAGFCGRRRRVHFKEEL